MKTKSEMTSAYEEGIEALLQLDEFVEFFVYFGIKTSNNNNNNSTSLLTGEQLDFIQKICEQHILSDHKAENKANLYTEYITKYKAALITDKQLTPFKVIDTIIKSIINNYNNNNKLTNKVYNIVSPILYNPKDFILNTESYCTLTHADTTTTTNNNTSKSTFDYIKRSLKAVRSYCKLTHADTTTTKADVDVDVDVDYDMYYRKDIHIDDKHDINKYQPLYLLVELNDKDYSFKQIPKKCNLNTQYYSMKYVIAYNTSSKNWVRFEFDELKGLLKSNKINELIYKDVIYINESVDQVEYQKVK